MRLWKAVTLTSGTKAYWMLGAMVATVITARYLGPQGRGVIAAATSWVALFVTFGHFSLSNVIIYLLGGEQRERLLPVVTGSVLALVAATTLLGWSIAAAMHVFTHGRLFQHIDAPVLAIAFAGLPFLLWMENGNSLLIVLGDLKRLNLAAMSTFFFTNIAVILLNQFRPVAEAGFFQLGMQFTLAMAVVPMAIAVVAYSIVARDGADGAWPEHRTLVFQTMLYALVAAVVAYAAAPVVVPLIAGRAFAPAVPVFRIMTLSTFGLSLNTVMPPEWIARGFFLRATALALSAAAVGVAGNVLLIPRYGMAAAAWMMVASYTIHFVGHAVFALWIERGARLEPALEPLRG